MRVSWFKQAVTKEDNKTYEAAYLALAVIVGLALFSVVNLLAMAWYDLMSDIEHEFNYVGLGGGIAAIIGALAGFLAGVGSYILMDRKGSAASEYTTYKAGPGGVEATSTKTEAMPSGVKES